MLVVVGCVGSGGGVSCGNATMRPPPPPSCHLLSLVVVVGCGGGGGGVSCGKATMRPPPPPPWLCG